MKIFVNGLEREIYPSATVSQFINTLKINQKNVIVELNREVIEKQNYSNKTLKEGDEVELIRFIGGG